MVPENGWMCGWVYVDNIIILTYSTQEQVWSQSYHKDIRNDIYYYKREVVAHDVIISDVILRASVWGRKLSRTGCDWTAEVKVKKPQIFK